MNLNVNGKNQTIFLYNEPFVLQCAHHMTKQRKEQVLRARCDGGLKSDVQWAASVERLEEADIIRRGTADYVQRLRMRTMPQPPMAHAA